MGSHHTPVSNNVRHTISVAVLSVMTTSALSARFFSMAKVAFCWPYRTHRLMLSVIQARR